MPECHNFAIQGTRADGLPISQGLDSGRGYRAPPQDGRGLGFDGVVGDCWGRVRVMVTVVRRWALPNCMSQAFPKVHAFSQQPVQVKEERKADDEAAEV